MSLGLVNGPPVNGSLSTVEPFTLSAVIAQQISGSFTLSAGIEQSIYTSLPNFAQADTVGVRILLGGTEQTVVGVVRVEAEEGMARTAEFSIVPAAGVVDVDSWFGADVTIDYDVREGATVAHRSRLFTGVVVEPKYDVIRGIATMTCADDFQAVIDGMTTAQIDDLTPEAVFCAPIQGEDLQGYDYLQARLESLPASVDLSPTRVPRLTDWAAKSSPDLTFAHTSGQVVDDSEQVAVSKLKDATNLIEHDFTYRYTRLRERREHGRWDYGGSFCQFFADPSDLPNREMIASAIQQTGWITLGLSFDTFLPVTDFVDCTSAGIGTVAWIIDDILRGQLVTSASWVIAKRYAQAVEEQYHITVRAPGSQLAHGDRMKREESGFSADYDAAEWVADLETQSLDRPLIQAFGATRPHSDFYQDKDDVEGFDRATCEAGLDWAVRSARRQILDAHRESMVAFETLLDPRLDLTLTVRLDTPRILAKGKVRRVVHEIETSKDGFAMSTVQLAISRAPGGFSGLTDAVERPPKPTVEEPEETGDPLDQERNTQLGGKLLSGPHDPDAEGFSGNYRSGWNATSPQEEGAELYPVEFTVTTSEITSETSGTRSGEVEAEYLVSVPDDQLVITAP